MTMDHRETLDHAIDAEFTRIGCGPDDAPDHDHEQCTLIQSLLLRKDDLLTCVRALPENCGEDHLWAALRALPHLDPHAAR